MKKLVVLWVLLSVTLISCSPDKSQPQTIPGQTPTKEAQQLDEYENKILDRVETFYNNQMSTLLWIMGVGLAIVGIVTPLLLELYRGRNFKRELADQLAKSEDELKKYSEKKTKELEAELTKEIYSPLSHSFLGLAGLFSTEESPAGHSLALRSYVLAMKYHIISQCLGASLKASTIISIFTDKNRGDGIKLKSLKNTDELLEEVKEDVKKIVDEKKREDMASQVSQLQIYIHQLIYKKQQTPPQTSPQQS